MHTRIDEIADDVFRVSTYLPDVAPPAGFTFNQYVVRADEPLLFHTGMKALFPAVAAAVATVLPLERLRWVAFGHVESDECGAVPEWLAAAPHAQVTHHQLGCVLGLGDVSAAPAVPRGDEEVLDLGGHRVRFLATPHVPHNWESQVLHVDTAGVLLCGDLFTALGDGPAVTGADPVGPAMEAEDVFGATALGPQTPATLRRLATYRPTTLGLMHGSAYAGDGADALTRLADAYDARLQAVA